MTEGEFIYTEQKWNRTDRLHKGKTVATKEELQNELGRQRLKKKNACAVHSEIETYVCWTKLDMSRESTIVNI